MDDHMTGDILPPIKLGGHDDASMSRTLRSSQGLRKDAQINKKLEQITEQLKAVRLKRLSLKKNDDGRVYGPKTDYTTVPKKFFSHPRLDYVYGEIMHSPYLTNPKDRYPKAVYTMAETIKEFKHKGITFNEIPVSERPYDQALMKRSFIKEVCNYNPKFNIPKAKKSTTGSVTDSFKRASTANSSILGRSTAGSSISSATSMKEFSRTGPSGFDRPDSSNNGTSSGTGRGRSASGNGRTGVSTASRGKLNEVKPRKHASSTSMSLDASGFVPSSASMGGSNLLSYTANATGDHGKTNKLVKAMSQAAEFVREQSLHTASMKCEKETENDDEYAKDEFNEPEEEYNDDFIEPPEIANSSLPALLPTPLPTTAAVEEEYEQDFDTTIAPVMPVVDVPQQVASNTPNNAPDAAYKEDFEPEVEQSESSESIPSEKVLLIYAATSGSAEGDGAEGSWGGSGSGSGRGVAIAEDVYPDDFAAESEVVAAAVTAEAKDVPVSSSTGDVIDVGSAEASASGSVEERAANVAQRSSSSSEVDAEDAPSNAISSVRGNSGVDAYTDDFEAPTVEVPVVPAPLSTVSVLDCAVENEVYDNLGTTVDSSNSNEGGASIEEDNVIAVVPADRTADSSSSTISDTGPAATDGAIVDTTTVDTTPHTSSVSNKVDPESIKLRTDLVPGSSTSAKANTVTTTATEHSSLDTNAVSTDATHTTHTTHMPLTHENTTHSVLSDQSNQSIKTDEHTFSPPVPSTVRSELSYPDKMLSQSNSYNNSFNNDICSEMDVSENYTEHNTPKSEHKSVSSGGDAVKDGIAAVESEEVESEVVDEVADEVVVVGHTQTSEVGNVSDAGVSGGVSSGSGGVGSLVHDTSEHIVDDSVGPAGVRECDTIVDTADLIDTVIDTSYHTAPDTVHHTAHSPASPSQEIDTIDTIAYTEHKNTSVKQHATVSNNYLLSPVKAGPDAGEAADAVDVDHNNSIVGGTSVGCAHSITHEVEAEVERAPDFEVSSPVRDEDADLYEIED